jgi:hypothetical protein
MLISKYKNKKTQINFHRFYYLFSQGWTLYFLHANNKFAEKDISRQDFLRLSFSGSYLLPLIESRSIKQFEPSLKGELVLFGVKDARIFKKQKSFRRFQTSVPGVVYQLGGFVYNYHFPASGFFSKLEKNPDALASSILNMSVLPVYNFFLSFYKQLFFFLIHHAYYKSASKEMSKA